jgi:SAM-dependent methyltransferase
MRAKVDRRPRERKRRRVHIRRAPLQSLPAGPGQGTMRAMADEDLDGAYALDGPASVRAYYAGWAARYDAGFAAATGYALPATVAADYAAAGGGGPVLDVGAGTGLVAEALAGQGIGPVDGVDLSPEMLARAAVKGLYRHLVEADVTRPLTPPEGPYAGIVSAGTFTQGHVGPEAIPVLLAAAAPGALFAISVHERVWTARGFPAAFAALGPAITGFEARPVAIYTGAAGAHAGDRAHLVRFRKAG